MRIKTSLSIHVLASILIAIFTFSSSILITRELSYSSRATYGILTVIIGQGFLIAQRGLPGAINTLGLGALMKAPKKETLAFILQRIFFICAISITICILYELPILVFICAPITYAFLAVFQIIMAGMQKIVTSFEYSFIRVLSSALFFLINSIIITSWELTLESAVFAWTMSIVSSLTYVIVRLTHLYKNIEDRGDSLRDLRRFANKGFIAHISFQDLFRMESVTIPFLIPGNQVALYFAVLGISQWPKVLVDGIANSIVQRYPEMDRIDANVLGRRTMIRASLVLLVITILTLPVQIRILDLLIGEYYKDVSMLYSMLLLSSIFNNSRRLRLDALRTNSEISALFSSKIEFSVGFVVNLSIISLYMFQDLRIWSICLATFSFAGFLYIIFSKRMNL